MSADPTTPKLSAAELKAAKTAEGHARALVHQRLCEAIQAADPPLPELPAWQAVVTMARDLWDTQKQTGVELVYRDFIRHLTLRDVADEIARKAVRGAPASEEFRQEYDCVLGQAPAPEAIGEA